MASVDFVHHPHPHTEKRAVEAILRECLQMQEHLHAQDRVLASIITRMEQAGR